MNFVVVGQAFHWFDPKATKVEVQRILRSGKQVALIWNRRDLKSSPFQRDYEELLKRFGTDYSKVDQQRTITDEKISAFFSPNNFAKATFPNRQTLSWAGLRGRLFSASYVPTEDHENYQPMLNALEDLFKRNQSDGFVQFEYSTVVYHGVI